MPTPFTGSPVSDVLFTGNPQIDGLIIGTKWGGALGTAVTVSYSFPDTGSTWSTVAGGDPLGYDASDPANNNPFTLGPLGYHGLDGAQQDAVRESLAAWSQAANITFLEVADNATVVGDIRVAFTNGGDIQDAYAYAYTPAPFAYGGDVWLNSVQPVPSGNDFSIGAAGYNTLIHELGHAIGLDHPFSNPQFPAQFESLKYSVMSYSDFPGHQDSGDSSLYPTTPMLLDIQALQVLYGANMAWETGDNTYVFLEGGRYYQTIWDAGGTDTLWYDSALDGARIDLRAGSFSQLGEPITLSDGSLQHDDVAIAFNAVIENATGGEGNDVLIGNAAANSLTGNGGNDSLSGDAGDDWLEGGTGNDTMAGGTGNDSYVVEDSDSLTEAAGAGTDTVRSAASYVLTAANVENVTLTGFDSIDATGNAAANTLTGNDGNNVLNGGGGNDTMAGGGGDDSYHVNAAGDRAIEASGSGGTDQVFSSVSFTLGANLENLTLTGAAAIDATGNELVNVLTGNSGANLLDGQAGADMLAGGPGNDSYVYDADDLVIEETGEGSDTVRSALTYALAIANLENVTLTGGDAVDAIGDGFANVLTGNNAANVLDGQGGADTLAGGGGNDTYYVDEAGDSVLETSAAGGIDRVFSLVSFTLGANLENLTLDGAGAIHGTGNGLHNLLIGNGNDNALDGGAGNDTLEGGDGNDSYTVDAAGDGVLETNPAGGDDHVFSRVSFTLGANLEFLTLTGNSAINATGNELDNIIGGNSAANLLDGGLGNDTLAGGAGNDRYAVDSLDDSVTELAGQGTDRVESSLSWTLGENLENLTLTGTGDIDATGNAANNALTGNGGNNVLNGGDGNDTMTGGAGNDTYFVVEIGDVVIETGGGNDTVISSRSISLAGTAAGIENLTLLAGSAAQSATGNAQDNVLTGNRNDNVLSGGAGNDVLQGGRGYDLMAGGAGNDTYYVNRGDGAGTSRLAPFEDQVVEALNAGTDTVYSSMYTYTLDANVENLVLEGVGRKGFGNALNNTLTGNALNNTFAGGAGNDRFAFGSLDGSVDRILDYNVANDTIQLSLAVFQGIGTIGNFNVNAFVSNGAPVALEAGDRILYNSTTGALYYDADGSDAGVAVQFALLSGAPALTFADIAVIA